MFLQKKYEELEPAHKAVLDRYVQRVTRRHTQYLGAQKSEVIDRVQQAFRSSAAKAAKIAATAGRIDDAILWYDEAVKVDEKNAALWDRFAWFLMAKVGDLKRAAECARQACYLDPNDADAAFTAGMIAARAGDVRDADRLLQKAAALDKPAHLVKLQRARARIEALADAGDDATKLYTEADNLLAEATHFSEKDWKAHKHLRECREQQLRLLRIGQRLAIPPKPVVVKRRGKRIAALKHHN